MLVRREQQSVDVLKQCPHSRIRRVIPVEDRVADLAVRVDVAVHCGRVGSRTSYCVRGNTQQGSSKAAARQQQGSSKAAARQQQGSSKGTDDSQMGVTNRISGARSG